MTARRGSTILLAASVVSVLAVGAVGTTTAQSGTSIDYDGDTLTLHPTVDQTITGTTDVTPGSEVSVRLQSSGSNPFIKSKSATVTDSGTFNATFDLSDIPAGTEFTVQVVHDGEKLTTADGRIVKAPETTATETSTATPTATVEPTTESSVPLTTIGVIAGVISLALGGFVLYSRFEE